MNDSAGIVYGPQRELKNPALAPEENARGSRYVRGAGSQPLRTIEIKFRTVSAALTFVLLVSLAGCISNGPPSIPPQQANEVSLAPQNWYIYYSALMPPNPSVSSEGAWSLAFPSWQSGGHVNYVQTPFNMTTTLHNVNLTFMVASESPQYKFADPNDILPATVHIFFEQQNDDLSDPNGRWWAGASQYNLGSQDNTSITYSIALTPEQWSNVNGQSDPQAFQAALNNIGWIGVTFGGQYFWGHGVALTGGSASFVLVNLSVD